MWVLVAILLGLVLAAGIGYRMMIGLKPGTTRPVLDASARTEMQSLERRLMNHVNVLGSTIGERNLYRPRALQAAVEYIRKVWTAQGLAVSEESFEVAGQPCSNLVAELKGTDRARQIVVVGAHYDSVVGSPGTNDNGTGVALLLEMSLTLKRESLSRTVRFVAFVNEEPPYFHTEQMGSRVHARQARRRGEDIVAMLSLETLGYYADARGTQRYPPPLGFLYPSTGNFLGVVGNLPSRRLVVEFLGHFMSVSDFPVEAIAAFEGIPGIGWSDHWSFWKEGYPALMLTDTAPFRYPEYHGGRDLPDQINAREYARAAHGIIHAVRRLAGGR
jgi:Zn-dependent M28 family amino/carboxypeptidase